MQLADRKIAPYVEGPDLDTVTVLHLARWPALTARLSVSRTSNSTNRVARPSNGGLHGFHLKNRALGHIASRELTLGCVAT